MSRKCPFERRRASIIALFKQGGTVKQIVRALNLPEATVRFHLSSENIDSFSPDGLKRPTRKLEPKPVAPRQAADLDNPVTLARMTLGSRVTERLGSYWIDGQPVGIDRLIQSANSALREQGKPQIRGKAEWAV